jgi:hypothetical protein
MICLANAEADQEVLALSAVTVIFGSAGVKNDGVDGTPT